MNKDKIIDDFLEGFENFLLSRNERKQIKNIHCSSLASCKRQVVLDFFDFQRKKITLAKLLMFEISNFIHRLVADYIQQNDKFVANTEIKITEGLPDGVSGRADIIAIHKETNSKILIDTKTANPHMFYKKYDTDLPKEEHIPQINAYAYACRKLGFSPDILFLIYFDRGGTNTPQVHEVYHMNDEDIENIFNEYKKAIENYKTYKVLPNKIGLILDTDKNYIVAKKSWQCSYCDFEFVSCEGYEGLDSKKFTPIAKIKGDTYEMLERFRKNDIEIQVIDFIKKDGLPF